MAEPTVCEWGVTTTMHNDLTATTDQTAHVVSRFVPWLTESRHLSDEQLGAGLGR